MSSAPNSGERGRFSSQRKTAAVLRLLRGEDLELVSRELGIIAATLSGWRDDFLAGGQAALKSRSTDDRDDEIARLRAKVGELTMDNELRRTCSGSGPSSPSSNWPKHCESSDRGTTGSGRSGATGIGRRTRCGPIFPVAPRGLGAGPPCRRVG